MTVPSQALPAAALARYTLASEATAAQVIATYSTSFSLASRLLGPRCRRHVRNIYGLVRLADEVVDGAVEGAGLPSLIAADYLDELEAQTLDAITTGYSTNPLVHAFATTARHAGIDATLVRPFFASMRSDLTVRVFDDRAHRDYVYGSAEAVGLMCLRVFLQGRHCTAADLAELETGARALGAAFQNVNFLRDLAADNQGRGRNYLAAESENELLDTAAKARWSLRIHADLDRADAVIDRLPADCRPAVRTAHALFADLLRLIDQTTAADLHHRRVRVTTPRKLWIAARSVVPRPPSTWRHP